MERIIIKDTSYKGKGLFANKLIMKDELIFDWTGGIIYTAEQALDLPPEAVNHAVQIAPHQWIDTVGIGRISNHSCEPNAGFSGLFHLVAMRDIHPGEEITWDYDMTENSNWVLKECKCGAKNCRNTIRGFRFLPEEFRNKYKGYISDWLCDN